MLLWNDPARACRVASGAAVGPRLPPDLLIAAASSHRSLEDTWACSSPIVCRVILWMDQGGISSPPEDFSLGRDDLSSCDLRFNIFTLIATLVHLPSGKIEFCFTVPVEQLLNSPYKLYLCVQIQASPLSNLQSSLLEMPSAYWNARLPSSLGEEGRKPKYEVMF